MRTQTRSLELHPFLETLEARRIRARERQLWQAAHPKLRQEARSPGFRPTSGVPAARAPLRAQRVRRFLSAVQQPAPKEGLPHSHTQSVRPTRPLPTIPVAFFERGRRSPERAERYKWSNLYRLHVAKPTRS